MLSCPFLISGKVTPIAVLSWYAPRAQRQNNGLATREGIHFPRMRRTPGRGNHPDRGSIVVRAPGTETKQRSRNARWYTFSPDALYPLAGGTTPIAVLSWYAPRAQRQNNGLATRDGIHFPRMRCTAGTRNTADGENRIARACETFFCAVWHPGV